MKEIEVASWEAFEQEVAKLRQAQKRSDEPLLFRGHGNSTFTLSTTLERAGFAGISFSHYYSLMSVAQPAVETTTDTDWEVPPWSPALDKDFRDFYTFKGKPEGTIMVSFPSGPVYRLMMYLRHHGFPSPLLDWTYSPNVAALFAFREPMPSVAMRSIYVFRKSDGPFQVWSNSRPLIRRIGPYQRSNRRHFQQQSDYTICGVFTDRWFYHSHQDAFEKAGPHQDIVTKFNLPSTLRGEVLKRLDQYNVNAYSLFGNEEGLMETVWNREISFQPDRFKWNDTFEA